MMLLSYLLVALGAVNVALCETIGPINDPQGR